jgi:GntR family carbon starvation induced transcriptional regulator
MKMLRPSDMLYGKTRANDVWYRLREDILSGVLLPGQWLRFENLRTVYDVSYATLREALSKLAYEGLVVADAQRGFTVAPISADDLVDLTSVRIMIEAETLKRSIKNGGDNWRSDILAAFHRMDKFGANQIEAGREWTAVHREFHGSLVSACDSPLLLEYRAALFDKANRYRRLSRIVRPFGLDRSSEHREMMEAVLSRDIEYASKLISQHIQETTDNILAAIAANADAAAVSNKDVRGAVIDKLEEETRSAKRKTSASVQEPTRRGRPVGSRKRARA